jgi:hypothetical protein
MTRVQIPAYTDWWMKGARYGEVVGYGWTGHGDNRREVCKVRLDATGTVHRFIADDCEAAS